MIVKFYVLLAAIYGSHIIPLITLLVYICDVITCWLKAWLIMYCKVFFMLYYFYSKIIELQNVRFLMTDLDVMKNIYLADKSW